MLKRFPVFSAGQNDPRNHTRLHGKEISEFVLFRVHSWIVLSFSVTSEARRGRKWRKLAIN